ncbi:hypothetical protein [Parabacteroides sp. Marseille-P3160]|uniref:methyltransferase RsmF C-terminal domain-like protein n=1 Tax=Parabacteroides sp. Marseille-P3160 TaxID=1917887 RepID=UPI003510BC5F
MNIGKIETLILTGEIPKGIVLMTYKNFPLDLAKQLGNRANNLYPPEWRIRTGYWPENVKTL